MSPESDVIEAVEICQRRLCRPIATRLYLTHCRETKLRDLPDRVVVSCAVFGGGSLYAPRYVSFFPDIIYKNGLATCLYNRHIYNTHENRDILTFEAKVCAFRGLYECRV